MAKKKETPPLSLTNQTGNGGVTSFYLDNDSKEKLDALAGASGLSRSLVVRNLIQQAGSEDKVKLRSLVSELSDMVDAT